VPDLRSAVPMHAVPKPAGGVRWLARLDPVDDARYRSLVAPLTPRLERALGPEVLANRAVGRGRLATVNLEAWGAARATWDRRTRAALDAGAARHVFITDVATCYPSIAPAVVARRLRRSGAGGAAVESLERFLHDLGERGVRGLPTGPSPSALLANLVLADVDDRLRATGVRHLRWVDDIVVFAAGHRQALRAIDATHRALDELGLRPNPRKTVSLTDLAAIRGRLLGGGRSMWRTPAWDDAAP
jgi:hypothetical protein